MTGFIAGIDEAGRGPVIGPLVICVAAIEDGKEKILKDMGAKDSKLLSEEQRERILEDMKDLLHFEVVKIDPKEIDDAVLHASYNLNWLEADKGAEALNILNDKLHKKIIKTFIDCPSTNVSAYKKHFQGKTDDAMELIVEHKADSTYVIVSAASIIAKVTREKEIEKLKRKYNVDFGSGYPSDPRTKEFIKKHHADPRFQELFRKSWSTFRDAGKKQSSLDQY